MQRKVQWLFIPFTQVAQIRIKGHGLGLSIVRRIMEKLGGHVGVESEGVPGKGCVFSFSLPAAHRSDMARTGRCSIKSLQSEGEPG